MEEILVWLFEGEVRLVLFGIVAALLVLKWLVEAGRGIAMAMRETRRGGNR